MQNLAWISFTHGNVARAESRLEESADLFGELGDWGGLSWAYGLLAFVRPWLEEAGEWDEVRALVGQSLSRGSGARRQREALARSGRIEDVVDSIVEETERGVTT